MKISKSFAQFGTDIAISSYFHDGEILYGLDIGAVDGIFINNTYALEKEHNANILCVEANPYYEKYLKKNRRLSKSCAVGNENRDNVDFYVVNVHEHNNLSSVSSLSIDEELLENHQRAYTISQWVEKVNVRTIDYLLQEWGPPKLDFISMDIEGTELEALSAWTTFDLFKPKLCIIEANSEKHKNNLINFFENKHYTLCQQLEVNLFFKPL